MSEQPTPPKPKPGSLRDRIAAFEKPTAATGQPSGPPPAPRPKPGGLSWKPKPPSPPSSPSISESISDNKKVGGMSAIDAKESIGKGGSLKERMAALQNRGGFGAPPPVAPKPPLEKPKWKPPPVVAPVDRDDDEDQTRGETPRSPPLPRKLSAEVETADNQEEGAIDVSAVTEGEEPDPEEEERQRRAGIAARLARLGGTRVGMGPPIFGQKPPIKKSEIPAEAIKPEAPEEEGEEPQPMNALTSSSDDVLEESPQQQSPEPEVKPPARQSSISSTSLSPEPAAQQSRSPPTSMPLPAAPRRAGPPRKKSAKSPEIPSPNRPPVLGEDLVVSPDDVPEKENSATAEGDEEVHAGDVEKEIYKPESVESMTIETSKDDAGSVDFTTQSTTQQSLTPEADGPESAMAIETSKDDAGSVDFTTQSTTQQSSTPEADGLEEHHDSDVGHDKSVEPDDEDHPTGTGDNHDSTRVSNQPQIFAEPQDLAPGAEKYEVERATGELNEEEDEEAAHRQRIAEKLAKMGGVDPLAMPPQRKPSASAEDEQISPTTIERDTLSSSTPPRRQSTRNSSSDIVPSSDASDAVVLPQTTDALPESPKSTKSMDDSKPTFRSHYSAAPAGIREKDSDIEEIRESDEATQKTDLTEELSPEEPDVEAEDAAEFESEDTSDIENEFSPPPPPVVNRDTRPMATPSVPVDSALPVQPISSAPSRVVPPSTRPMPPPRLIPQTSENEEANDSDSNYSPDVMSPPRLQQGGDYDIDDELTHRLPPRSMSTEDTIDDDSSPLPVPHRRSQEADRDDSAAVSFPQFNKPPLPPAVPESVSDEVDSDFDEALPTRPLRRSVTPGTPPTNEIPLIVPPPAPAYASQKAEPTPLRQSFAPVRKDTSPLSSGEASPSHLSVSDQEVLDEDEGDPIDPSFHSPSRRASTIIAPPNPALSQPSAEPEEDEQTERRRTIAERMAKLGGIKFGAAPLQPPVRSIPKPREEEEGVGEPATGGQFPTEISEEEEERSRKERIAAKLAGMGGMRIGMLPPGFGPARPSAPRVQSTEPGAEAHPSRAVPPSSRVPPPPVSNDSDLDPESSLSASQQSLSTSDDGVKVEAEESEIEEVSHADAAEPQQEELPPPVPARGPRRQATGSESEQPTRGSVPRPPVPTSNPGRRPSTQTITSLTARKSSADSSHSIPQKSSSTYKPQSEYVMVEEPSGFTPDDNEDVQPPPLPPARPSNRPPPARGVPPPPRPADSISSQWELPSIPTSSLEFGNTSTDLSLSWPSDTNPAPSQSHPGAPASFSPEIHTQAASAPEQQQNLSADELMALWGRVGVQICEVATTLYEKSKKSLIGDGSYDGFIRAVLSEVPNAAMSSSYGYLVYSQTGGSVHKRVSDIMPGDVIVLQEAKLKGHKGLQTYHQTVGVGEQVAGIVSEFEPKRSKVRVFQANQHVGQQTVEAVSYRLEDLKSGTAKVYRVLESK